MSQPRRAAAEASIKACDPIWDAIRSEAAEIVEREPVLGGFVHANVLDHDRLEDAICARVAQRLGHEDLSANLIGKKFQQTLKADPTVAEAFRADLAAVADRDPACSRRIDPLLYFKGFHALQAYRFAHWLYFNGERDFAFYLQSQSSRVFGVDIHPAAKVGHGIMLDHATGIVIGETASVGDMTSLLHGVTLGGSGKESGDRHPKVGKCVLIGAGAKILGNITVGDCSRVAAGSVVLKNVAPKTTVAGVPARVIGGCDCPEPGRTMDQMVGVDAEEQTGQTGR
jgi:serine O-acetyltransferase